MKNFVASVFTLVFFSGFSLIAQDISPDVYSLTAEEASFYDFKILLERQTGFNFYFDPSDTDSLRISLVATKQSLTNILEEALKDTELLFTIDKTNNNIFVTKGQKISLELPNNLIRNNSEIRDVIISEDQPAYVFDYFEILNNFNKEETKKVVSVGVRTSKITPGKATVKGQVRDSENGQPVIGASIILEEPFIGAATDQFGNYSITLPKGRRTLKINAVGMRDMERNILLYGDGSMDIEMLENVVSLNEVVVRSDRDRNVSNTQMGVEKISLKTIKQLPSVMGEPDVLRVMQTLPGVKTVGEASTGFNVRGGAVDQNLILYNNATIYNPSHLFGFFSAINSDFINEVELYKSSIPAKFGGRLSSVMDMSAKFGNKKKISGSAGIGLLTSKISVGGPIIKDKTSFLIGGRLTYSNWLLNLIENSEFKNSSGSFYDANINLDHEINEKSSISFTGYLSNDKFRLRSDSVFSYDNLNGTLKWKQKLSEKTYGEFGLSFSRYNYKISSEEDTVNAFQLKFLLDQYKFNADFQYSLNPKHTLSYGFSTNYYSLKPGSLTKSGISQIIPDHLEQEQAVESAIYLEDQYEVSSKLTFNIGLRYSLFNYLGEKSVFTYREGLPVEDYNRIDTLTYDKGSLIKTYHGPEYRLAARYLINDDLSLKVSYNTLRQYIHMLTNSTAISPTDIWKLSDPNIQPQSGDQFSVGIYKNFLSGIVETSIEGYYKNIKNYLDYKAGARLVMNHEIETDVISTRGKAYGVEFMVKKSLGKLNGWISYVYSKSLLQADNFDKGEVINEGKWYPSNFDKPHDFSFIGNYKFSHRFSFSLNTTYSTGRPITIPIAKYEYLGSERVYYSERNAYRIPNYFRADISMNIEGNHKVHQKTHNSWTIGIYNITGRRNAYSTYFVSENGAIKGYKLSIFGSAIPYVNFNIKF